MTDYEFPNATDGIQHIFSGSGLREDLKNAKHIFNFNIFRRTFGKSQSPSQGSGNSAIPGLQKQARRQKAILAVSFMRVSAIYPAIGILFNQQMIKGLHGIRPGIAAPIIAGEILVNLMLCRAELLSFGRGGHAAQKLGEIYGERPKPKKHKHGPVQLFDI